MILKRYRVRASLPLHLAVDCYVMSASSSSRFGIAEWFGRRVQELSAEERERFAEEAKKNQTSLPCLPRASRSGKDEAPACTKRGGVCSIRLYDPVPADREDEADDDEVEAEESPPLGAPARGPIVTLCPHRFKEEDKIYRWTGEVILDDPAPELVREVPFLERDLHPDYATIWDVSADDEGADQQNEVSDDDVGRIDGILISADVKTQTSDTEHDAQATEALDDEPLEEQLEKIYSPDISVDLNNWCGLEIQSVYFSGDRMSLEYPPFTEVAPPRVPFPQGRRRPDFRSSSAKRLLPQLQTKIPSLRRWGKKMAVIVDEAFFYEMAEMEAVNHISNGDIVWIVVGYEEEDGELRLRKREVHCTTLEDAVVGLTAGRPVARDEFEKRTTNRLKAPIIEAHMEDLNEELDRLMLRRDGLQTTIDAYIERMETIRANRARQNKRLQSTSDVEKRARLSRSIEIQDRQLETLWERRRPVEAKEERLKERCKAIRSVRARLNEEIR